MSKINLTILTKADKWLIILLLSLSLAGVLANLFLFANTGNSYAQISVNGKIFRTIALREGYYEEITIKENNLYNIIEINGAKLRIKEANCPDKICLKTGWISIAPNQIVCLPNLLVVKIVCANANNDLDDITR